MSRLKRMIEKEYDSMTEKGFEKIMMDRVQQKIHRPSKKNKVDFTLIYDFLMALIVSILIYFIATKVRYVEVDIPIFVTNNFIKNSNFLLVLLVLTILLFEEKSPNYKKTFIV